MQQFPIAQLFALSGKRRGRERERERGRERERETAAKKALKTFESVTLEYICPYRISYPRYSVYVYFDSFLEFFFTLKRCVRLSMSALQIQFNLSKKSSSFIFKDIKIILLHSF